MPTRPRADGSGLWKATAALFLVSLALAAGVLWNRHQDERAMDRVILAVDGDEVERIAEEHGATYGGYLRVLRSRGVTAVGVHEYTLQEAVNDGRAFVLTGGALTALLPAIQDRIHETNAPSTILGASPTALDPWLSRALERRLPDSFRPIETDGSLLLWQVPEDPSLSDISLGFHPEEIETVLGEGLAVIPRPRPAGDRTPDEIRRSLEPLRDVPVAAVVFWGSEVTGYPSYLDPMSEELRALGAPIGIVEFSVQQGLSEVVKELSYNAVRVHSITAHEMEADPAQETAIRRWERAVRERGVRLAYVRLYPDASAEENAAYVGRVAQALLDDGYRLDGSEGVVRHARPTPGWALAGAVVLVGTVGAALSRGAS